MTPSELDGENKEKEDRSWKTKPESARMKLQTQTMIPSESPRSLIDLPSESNFAHVPRGQVSRMAQFNANMSRKLRNVFSTVDWGQVSHYMDNLT